MPAILDVLREQQGVLTARQLFYRLVSKGIIPNALSSYIRLCQVLKQERVKGSIPWNRIVDRSKPIYQRQDLSDGTPEDCFESGRDEYENAEDAFREKCEDYYVPLWFFQLEYVEVWCEKDALVGVLSQVTEKWKIPLVVCRGYQSISNIYERCQEYKRQAFRGKKVTILYFGDYDPRGLNIPEIITRDFESLGFPVELNKIALTNEQIAEFNLIPASCKKTDTMARGWVENHGDAVYELDAIEPNTLVSIVENAVKSHFNNEKLEERERFIEAGKAELHKLVSVYFGGDSDGS